MISRYEIFCEVIEKGSFTKVAQNLGYSQSAVSQAVKTLEDEIGVTLIDRRKDGISLTPDGAEYFPYLRAIYSAEKALNQKRSEMKGLENSIIRIGTFTSVSRNILPPLMKSFKDIYPDVTFVLRQGEYTSICKWIQEQSIDFGFVNIAAVSDVQTTTLYEDKMLAVLPKGHSLSDKKNLSLRDLTSEPFILLDEGSYNTTLTAFKTGRLSPRIAYEVYDDYTILAMIKQNLGISLMYEGVLKGFEEDFDIRHIKEAPKRVVALACRNKDTMPYASKAFADYIIDCCKELKQPESL